VRLGVILLLLIVARTASAATCSWHGGVDLEWSTAGNWTNCATRAPQNGDSLLFPPTAATFTSQNDITNLQVAAVTISSPRFIISGVGIVMGSSAVTFNGVLYPAVSGASFLVPITLTGPVTITNVSPDLMQLSVGDLNLNGNTLTFDTAFIINEQGTISGHGRVEKDGSISPSRNRLGS
jgi:hypothetical protein